MARTEQKAIPTGAPGESRLLMAARSGDAAAFAELVAPHLDLAFRMAFLITGSAADAQDGEARGLDPPGQITTPGLEATTPGADEAALAGEERGRLLAAVGALREDDQLIIAARYFIGLSGAETATALSLRPGTVKSRLSRALARLRDALGDAA